MRSGRAAAAGGKRGRFIRRSSPTPVYRQVAEILERDVARRQASLAPRARPGEEPEGKRPLPSENELAAELGISRVTVRQALEHLHFKGLIYREKGRGSYVRERHIAGMSGFGSFTAEAEAAGARPASRLVGFARVTGLPPAMLGHLARPPDEAGGFFRLTRVRCLDGRPVALEDCYLPAGLYPGLEAADVATGSLYAAMRRLWGHEPAWADAAIEPGLADAGLAGHLGLEAGAPVVIAWRVTSSEQDVVLEYVRSVYRGGALALTIRRHRIG